MVHFALSVIAFTLRLHGLHTRTISYTRVRYHLRLPLRVCAFTLLPLPPRAHARVTHTTR